MLYTRRELEEAAGQAAGAAAGVFLARHPQDVMPTDEIGEALDAVLAGFERETDPALDRIRADVYTGQVPEGHPLAGSHKVRVTIWSGPDFRTPSVERGAVCDDPGTCEWAAERCLEALDLLGIPVEGREPVEALLPALEECREYDRIGRDEAIDRLVQVLDPEGANEQLAAWAQEAKADG